MIEAPSFFPPSPRVFYRKAPLFRVTGQVRFPSVLKIDAQSPFEFQDKVRDIFPLYEKSQSLPLDKLPQEILRAFSSMGAGDHKFISEDRKQMFSLQNSALIFSTSEYRKWDDFISRFFKTLAVLSSEYKPSFFTTVGLRYQDFIVKSTINAESLK
jgi:uncharacterized protein (TIGR04255 family)